MAVIIQIRRGTAAQWTTVNPTLADGEIGYETDTVKLKFGDGTTAWTALDYLATGGGDAHFLGKYISLAALETAHATAADGDYAIVDAGVGTDAKIYIWDADEGWVEGGGTGASTFADLTGAPTDNAALAVELNARQPIDPDLTAIAGLSPTNDDFMQRKAGAWANRTIAQVKTDLAIGNVDNTSDVNKPVSTAQAAALLLKQDLSARNQPDGYAGLDSSGKVASAQLPSYVDDVLEFANLASFPVTGETGKIYIAIDTNREYRWSGSVYTQIVASPGTTDNVPEGSTNLYHTAARVLATVLAGLSTATNAAITTADTILSALGKLQKQITDAIATIAAKATQTEVNTGTDTTKYVASDTLSGFMKKARAADVTANWSLAASDRYGNIPINSATATTGTIGATLAKDEWFVVTNKGVGNANLVGSGVTLTGYTSVKQGKSVWVLFTSSTTAICVGPSVIDYTDINPASLPTTILGFGITDGVQVLWTSVAAAGNATTTRTEIASFPMLVNALSANGHSAEARFAGNYAGNVNNKRIEVEFDGTVIFDTGSIAVAVASSWAITVDIVRVGATSQVCEVRFFSNVGALLVGVNVVSTTKTLANALNVKVFATATANNDITFAKGKAFKSGI